MCNTVHPGSMNRKGTKMTDIQEQVVEKVKKVAQDDGLKAVVRKLREDVDGIKQALEKLFNIDIDSDGKAGSARLAVLLGVLACSCIVSLAISPSSLSIWNLPDSSGTNDIIQVRSDGNLVVEGTITAETVESDSANPDSLSSPVIQSDASTAITVTGTQAVALTGSVIPLTAAAAVTNATLAAVASTKVGQTIELTNANTNDITILDSAPAVLSGNIVLGQYDSLTLRVDATNRLRQVSTSNN